MKRREFTASLAALAATPAIPLAAPAAAKAPAALPPGAYLWAELIARAQNACSPGMIAKHLRISSTAAERLFNQMLHDGVIKTPGLGGVAQAAKPMQAVGTEHTVLRKAAKEVTNWAEDKTASPLVNTEQAGLGCNDATTPEDPTHASSDQPPEESPESR